MYSYEIEEILKKNGHMIKASVYLGICDSSPQITEINYDAFSDNFKIWTNDNYYFEFKVRKD